MAATFVLVHGGGHGGWCWQRVARLLRAEGHDVYTPTLTGFGERSHLDTSGVTFETFVRDIVSVIQFEDVHDIVLVGHSMGGVIIPRVAEELPERMRRVVWLAAVVTNDGESLVGSPRFSPSASRPRIWSRPMTERSSPTSRSGSRLGCPGPWLGKFPGATTA